MRRLILTGLLVVSGGAAAEPASICYGTTDNGRLERGVALPGAGVNFTSYGRVPALAGRTYVHSQVRDVVVDAYQRLATALPDKRFKYAETGHEEGGPFDPHVTHQNGLSVDFMVPVVNGEGESVHLPTHMFNRYGYDIEFDASGRYEDYRLDFEALGAHIVALHKAAEEHGIGLWRVLFDPRLQPKLYATEHGDYIRKHVTIPSKRSWVRHDEHYHVDFEVECQPLP